MIYFNSQRKPFSTLQLIMAVAIFFLVLYIGFYITKWVLVFLSFIAPILLISAMILNFSTVKNFVKYLWQLILKNPVFGIVLTLVSILAFPVTSLILFFRARSQWRKKKSNVSDQSFDDSEYIDYIELPQEDVDNVETLKNYR